MRSEGTGRRDGGSEPELELELSQGPYDIVEGRGTRDKSGVRGCRAASRQPASEPLACFLYTDAPSKP